MYYKQVLQIILGQIMIDYHQMMKNNKLKNFRYLVKKKKIQFLVIFHKIFFFFKEQLQHVEKELHDKAQQHLKINQEYRQQVTDYVNSNTTSGKKKRTTSSSSTSSSS